jgi:hypothetical protein
MTDRWPEGRRFVAPEGRQPSWSEAGTSARDGSRDVNRGDQGPRATPESSEIQLIHLLNAVRDGDFADAPVDNEMLAAALQLSLVETAARLQEAKARSFVWGLSSGRQPRPWFTDLELTVQGRRFLDGRRAHPSR